MRDIIESDLCRNRDAAETEPRMLQEQYVRQEWRIDQYEIDEYIGKTDL